MKKHYRHEHDCLNCGTDLQGKYCHNCGQENLQIKESFGHMLNHAISDYFHFDHQFFHTLKPLLTQPGKLTADYLAGRRAQYLHPVKMYIFISLVFFLLVLKSGHEIITTNENGKHSKSEVADVVKKELDKNPKMTDAEKKEVLNNVKTALPGSSPVHIIKQKDGGFINVGGFEDDKKDKDSTLAAYQLHQSQLPANKRDGFIGRYFTERVLYYKEKYGDKAYKHFKEDLMHNVPKMMFVLLPLFALIVMVAFRRNKKYYVEHLIYAIHLHCFIFLFCGIIIIIQMILPSGWTSVNDWLSLALWIYCTYYVYRSLRFLYQRSRWRTISKMVGMWIMYWVVAIICFGGLAVITAASA